MDHDDMLVGLLTHPDLRDRYALGTLISLDAVMVELAHYGQPTLGGHERPGLDGTGVAWTGTLRWHHDETGANPIMAHSATPLMTALYLLMEVVCATRLSPSDFAQERGADELT